MTVNLVKLLAFTVLGKPQAVGSKRSYVPLDKDGNPYRRPDGRGVQVQTTESNEAAAPWMAAVRGGATAQ